ncbi:hypothetical protein BDP27DRAFT_1426388 [Rhodocollybia butyracea]|uniref:Uncharacterized protein n=1 Tax=Rhodocollybia butyracea TaxID=206335 RepID=A0A9P5U3N9_9AGAR|nr:hypothetical protein BDP27DRAFT_1426388 [Rhodocollybia butyracea]
MFIPIALNGRVGNIYHPLSTELYILPLCTRQLELNLKFLSYVVTLPPMDLVSLALQASSNLRMRAMPSWLMDVDWAIRNLPGSHEHLHTLQLIDPASIKRLTHGIRTMTLQQLDHNIDMMHKLRLLRGRLEPSKFFLQFADTTKPSSQ